MSNLYYNLNPRDLLNIDWRFLPLDHLSQWLDAVHDAADCYPLWDFYSPDAYYAALYHFQRLTEC